MSAYLVIGGVDFYGPHLYSVAAHGSTSMDPYIADGKQFFYVFAVSDRIPVQGGLNLWDF